MQQTWSRTKNSDWEDEEAQTVEIQSNKHQCLRHECAEASCNLIYDLNSSDLWSEIFWSMIWNRVLTCRTDRSSSSSLRSGSPASGAGTAAGWSGDTAEHRKKREHCLRPNTKCINYFFATNDCKWNTHSYHRDEQVLPQEVLLVEGREERRLWIVIKHQPLSQRLL